MLVLKLTESDTIATALDTIPSGEEVEVIYKGKKVAGLDRKSTRLNSSHSQQSRMPSSA